MRIRRIDGNVIHFPSDGLLERKKEMLLLKRGHKLFDIDGVGILALNYKNALRKSKNERTS